MRKNVDTRLKNVTVLPWCHSRVWIKISITGVF